MSISRREISTVETIVKQPQTDRKYLVDCRPALNTDELLLTVTATYTGDDDELVIDGEAPEVTSVDKLKKNGDTVPAGQGFEIRISGGTKGKRYVVEVTYTTDLDNTDAVDIPVKVYD